MTNVIHGLDGSKTVILTGAAAADLVAAIEANPPPHPVTHFRPGSVYNPATRVITPVYQPELGAELAEAERRAAHFQQLAKNLEASVADRHAQLEEERERVFNLRTALLAKEAELADAREGKPILRIAEPSTNGQAKRRKGGK